ncbi:hypothetical protein J1N35_029610 [Gossypium stocksii]|uniref:Uncharacterized protein n=1 Tax=Gossypium stocksii TaxID=47602 RepID=A0A9D3UY33_9ROSI|nr:hypothetical protein J1N35_029610 [Gossypium stocksii]
MEKQDSFFSGNLQDWMKSNLRKRYNFSLKGVEWQCFFGIIMWHIWKNMNLFIFRGDHRVLMILLKDRTIGPYNGTLPLRLLIL